MLLRKTVLGKPRSRNPNNQKPKKVSTYVPIGEGWHKQGPKVKFKSLRIFPEAVPYINRVLKSGQPINLTVMPNPKYKINPNEAPLKIFLVYNGIARN
jgi:hypothetical protein